MGNFVEKHTKKEKNGILVQGVILMELKAMGRRIRQRRRQLDITQERLAELAGVSTSFIGHIERGSRIPSLETTWRICRALGMSMDWAADGEEKNF